MKIVELILSDEEFNTGVEAISIVEDPAIEEDFVALKNQKEYKFAQVDKDKKILVGPLLIPNKPIYRQEGNDEGYYIYFSRDTVLKASQMFLKNGNQSKSTLEHEEKLNGLTLVESWIVEDPEMDKTKLYGMTLPKGSWAGTVKVDNDDVWEDYVKTGKVKGFSIEGYFADKAERPKELIPEELSKEEQAQVTIDRLHEMILTFQETGNVELESYTDYPSGVKNNAKRVVEWAEKNGWGSCGTPVGKTRASQIANGRPLSVSTIKRMASYLTRHRKDLEVSTSYSDGCGKLMYDAWGGKAGLRWAESKLKELNLSSIQIDGRAAFDTQEEAEAVAKEIGCKGYHTHELDEQIWYMPCESHDLKAPCWNGYEMIGTKMLNGKEVPNCVPIKRK
jgi:hypothetical protein